MNLHCDVICLGVACVSVGVIVMHIMNEPIPGNIPCTCYLVKVNWLSF